MGHLPILLSIALLVVTGCADPLERRSAQEVQDQLERGVTGQGTLGPIDRPAGDKAGEHAVPETHP